MSVSSAWSSRPAQAIRSVMPRGGRAVGVRRPSRGTPRGAAARRRVSDRSARAASRSPRSRSRARPSSAARNAPNPTIRSRARGSRASTSGHAASSSSTPLDAISLPTNTTSAVAGRDRRQRRGRLAGRAGERAARRPRPARRPRRGAACRRSRPVARGIRARAARSARRRRPAGPRRVRSSTDGSPIAAHRLSAVWREPTRIPRAPARPSHGVRHEPRMRLDGVLERAAVDLDRVRHAERAPARVRARPGPSRGGWPAPRPAARARPPPARPRRWRRRSGRPRPRRGPGTGAPRSPRSGRRRRAAAGRRCRAGRRSRARARGGWSTRQRAGVPVPAASTQSSASGSRSWHSRWTSWPARDERLRELGVVDVGAGPGEQVAVEDEDAHGAALYVGSPC